MFPVKEFEKRFRDSLGKLDDLRDGMNGEEAEQMDELNANFEDALFVIESIDQNEEEWTEEFTDALEEIKDLCASYAEIDQPEISPILQTLRMTIQMAENNLNL